MIRRSDGPKTYWGYYQVYLEGISGKNIQKKFPSIFSKTYYTGRVHSILGQNLNGARRRHFGYT